MILLASNNASSSLAGPIGPSATSLAVQSGAGAMFPSPGANEYFTVTLNDAATGLLTEIVWCTNVTGDTLTVQRAKEGTAAQSWLANDIVSNLWTAGSMAAMAQQGQLQSFSSNQAPDTGSVNAMVAALTPAPASLAVMAGSLIVVTHVVAQNTGAVTLNLNGFGAQPVTNPNGQPIAPSQILAGNNVLLTWNSAGIFQLLSITSASQVPLPYVNTTPGAYSAVPVPTGMTRGKVTLVGGGAGGGGCDGTHNAGGGGGGGICVKNIFVTSGYTVGGSVGAAGAAGTAGNPGGDGGDTTLQINGAGTVYTAHGGTGGAGGTATPTGGAGGTVTGGDLNLTGSSGGDGNPVAITGQAGNGGPGYLGAGTGRGSAAGGTTADATAPGAGAGGSYGSSSAGGKGFAGMVIIEWGP